MSDERLLRQFVESFKRLDDMQVSSDVPDEMTIEPRLEEWDDWRRPDVWRPLRVDTPRKALEPIYARLPGEFPPLYERLVLSYRWLEVDLGMVVLLANPPGPGLTGLARNIFRDRTLTEVLLPAGFVPFARASCSNYDPVCFDLKDGDCPIVQIEHESVLCHDEIGEKWTRWPSMRDFMSDVVHA